MSFDQRQILYDLGGARLLMEAKGASAKTLMPIDILAQAVEDTSYPQDVTSWADFTKPLGNAPRPVIAALARGLQYLQANLWAHQQRDLNEDIPEGAHLTRDRATVEAGILKLARMMTPETIRFVALADYGSRADKHEAALHDMVATDFAKMPRTNRWCPMEVVELVSHCPGDIGYLPSLAIVMLDALRTKDGYGSIAFRWEQNHAYIRALPEHHSAPLLAAVRYLYEDGDLESVFFSSYSIPAEGLLPFPAP